MKQKTAPNRDGHKSWGSCGLQQASATGFWTVGSAVTVTRHISARGQQLPRFYSKGCATEDAFLPVTHLLRNTQGSGWLRSTKTLKENGPEI